jgi:hypothetical protein
MLMWNFSWRHEGMKEDADVEAPDLTTVKDFLRFKAATSQGMIVEQTTYNSLNAFAEWGFFADFTRVTDTPTNKEDRSEVYDECVRKELADHCQRPLSDIHYCYLCFEWIIGET